MEEDVFKKAERLTKHLEVSKMECPSCKIELDARYHCDKCQEPGDSWDFGYLDGYWQGYEEVDSLRRRLENHRNYIHELAKIFTDGRKADIEMKNDCIHRRNIEMQELTTRNKDLKTREEKLQEEVEALRKVIIKRWGNHASGLDGMEYKIRVGEYKNTRAEILEGGNECKQN